MKLGIKIYFIMFVFMFYAITYKLNTAISSKSLLVIFSFIRISLTFTLILIIIFNSVFKVLITLKQYDLNLTSKTTIFNIFSQENSRIILKSTFYSIPYIIIGFFLNLYIGIPSFKTDFSLLNSYSITYSLSNIFSINILRFNSVLLFFIMFFVYFVILIIFILHKLFDSILILVNNKRFFEVRVKKMKRLIKIINYKLQKFINLIYKFLFIFIANKFINKIKRRFYLLLKVYKKGSMPPKNIFTY